MKKTILAALLLCLATGAFACTSVVVSGRVTKDGRPMMWKNTDGSGLYSSQRYSFHDEGKYAWVGLSQTAPNPVSAWFGTNEKGFSIMNTMSYSHIYDPEERKHISNGFLMKEALDACVTLEDFTHLLDTIDIQKNIKSSKKFVSSHYGVIDAHGGAAYVEVKYTGKKVEYWVMDVNDPAVAPDGWLVYANFGRHGNPDTGKGYYRHDAAVRAFRAATPTRDYTPQLCLDRCSRGFYSAAMGIDHRALVDAGLELGTGIIPFDDIICNDGTYQASVLVGVRPGEDPSLTTIWAALGCPATSVAIPLWVKGGREGINPLLRGNPANHDNAPICDMSLKLKTQIYIPDSNNALRYVNFRKLYNVRGDGYMQQLAPTEAAVFALTESYLEKWRKAGKVNRRDIDEINAQVQALILANPLYQNIPYSYEYK